MPSKIEKMLGGQLQLLWEWQQEPICPICHRLWPYPSPKRIDIRISQCCRLHIITQDSMLFSWFVRLGATVWRNWNEDLHSKWWRQQKQARREFQVAGTTHSASRIGVDNPLKAPMHHPPSPLHRWTNTQMHCSAVSQMPLLLLLLLHHHWKTSQITIPYCIWTVWVLLMSVILCILSNPRNVRLNLAAGI